MAENDPAPKDDPTPNPKSDPAPAKTFTQDDVDRIVQDRLARAKSTPPSDYEELKAKAAKLDEFEAKNKSDLEKLSDRAAALERERDEARLQLQEQSVRTALISEAAKKNAVDPDAVVSLVDRSSLEFNDDGSPKNVDQVVTALLDAKPYLTGKPSSGSADQGSRGGTGVTQVTREELRGMSDAEYMKAKSEGRLANLLAGK